MMIDHTQIPALVAGRRWFGGGSEPIAGAQVLDEAVIDDGPPALVIALARIDFESGLSSIYHLIALVGEDGGVSDALDDPPRLRVIGDVMAHGHTVKGASGAFEFGGVGLDPLSPPGGRSVRVLDGEQSNSSVVFDEETILKLFRRVEPGVNPDLELNRILTDEAFEHVPPHVGEIAYLGEIDSEEVEIDLGIAQQFARDAADGWSATVARLERFYDSAHPLDASEDRRALTEERTADLLEQLEQLGDATAAMHVLLSREEGEPELIAEPITVADLTDWASTTRALLRATTGTGISELDTRAAEIEARIDALEELSGELGQKTRVHGDYHLGQVLYGHRGWLIIDFEGEPLRALAERRSKQTPLKDVTGMLRSFSYAAIAALFNRAEPGSEDWARLEPWAEAWEDLARERFLGAYLRSSYEGRFLPPDRDSLPVFLDVFEIDKALYELAYERAHRPHWTGIPVKGIVRVVERGGPR